MPDARAGQASLREADTPPAPRRGKKVHLYARVGELRHSGSPGLNSLVFTGRIGRRALAPSAYRAEARAQDAAGNRSKARRVRFTIGPPVRVRRSPARDAQRA